MEREREKGTENKRVKKGKSGNKRKIRKMKENEKGIE